MLFYPHAIIFLLYRKLHPDLFVNLCIDTCLLSYIYYFTNTYSYNLMNTNTTNTTNTINTTNLI